VYSVAKNILKHEDHTFSGDGLLNGEYMDMGADFVLNESGETIMRYIHDV